MESDVCKHCTHAGCLDVVPDRRALPHRVRHGRRAGGRLQRLRLLRAGVPVRRHRQARPAAQRDDAPLALPLLGRKEDGRVWKCTLCYDRLKGGHEPACAKACPTDSIQFGELDELRERAQARLAKLEEQGWNGARLYGEDPTTASAASARSSCCSTSPRSTACRPTRSRRRKHLPQLWRTTALAAAAMVVGAARRRSSVGASDAQSRAPTTAGRSSRSRSWKPEVPVYFFTGGIAGGCRGAARARAPDAATTTSPGRRLRVGAAMEIVSPILLVSDLGRPERFLNMLRVFKVTSPMSVGSWILVVSGGTRRRSPPRSSARASCGRSSGSAELGSVR